MTIHVTVTPMHAMSMKLIIRQPLSMPFPCHVHAMSRHEVHVHAIPAIVILFMSMMVTPCIHKGFKIFGLKLGISKFFLRYIGRAPTRALSCTWLRMALSCMDRFGFELHGLAWAWLGMAQAVGHGPLCRRCSPMPARRSMEFSYCQLIAWVSDL